jgi:hypothetical protein
MQETILAIIPKQLSGGIATHLTYHRTESEFVYHLRNADSVSISGGGIDSGGGESDNELINFICGSLGIVII